MSSPEERRKAIRKEAWGLGSESMGMMVVCWIQVVESWELARERVSKGMNEVVSEMSGMTPISSSGLPFQVRVQKLT